jgi:hypothetical protein
VKVVFDNLANFLSIYPNQTPVFAVCLPGPSWTFLSFLFLLILYSLPYMYFFVYSVQCTCSHTHMYSTVCDQLCCEYMATVVHMLSYYEV